MRNEPFCTCSSDELKNFEHTDNCFKRAFEQGRQEVLNEVEKAFDLLGGMWSWSEENGYLYEGDTYSVMAGRILRKIVGRPARPIE